MIVVVEHHQKNQENKVEEKEQAMSETDKKSARQKERKYK